MSDLVFEAVMLVIRSKASLTIIGAYAIGVTLFAVILHFWKKARWK